MPLAPCETDLDFAEVGWAKPLFPRGQVDRAGQLLVQSVGVPYPPGWDEALQVINNWRSSHSYPLQSMKMGLVQRAARVDDKAIVAQRLKRLSSIEIKLLRNPNMKLTQMQDLGGCRGIVRGPLHLDKLVRIYDGLQYSRKYDYISNPKPDGYRGVHFVRKYESNLPQNQVWVGLRIETQLRTRLQHAWATAVETVDTFSAQQIKTGGGDQQWRRFFALIGSAIAKREGKPIVPGTPENEDTLKQELREAIQDLSALTVLNGWMAAVQRLPVVAKAGAQVFLLVLNTEQKTLEIVPFADEEGARASEQYLQAEKKIQVARNAQAVLVSVKSIRGLQAAYPNYFADTSAFIQVVERETA